MLIYCNFQKFQKFKKIWSRFIKENSFDVPLTLHCFPSKIDWMKNNWLNAGWIRNIGNAIHFRWVRLTCLTFLLGLVGFLFKFKNIRLVLRWVWAFLNLRPTEFWLLELIFSRTQVKIRLVQPLLCSPVFLANYLSNVLLSRISHY